MASDLYKALEDAAASLERLAADAAATSDQAVEETLAAANRARKALSEACAKQSKSRQEVYAAIDSERDYQTSLERNAVKEQRPMEQVALIRHMLRQFDAEWYSQPGQPSMDIIRKIGALCVRMMEEHGVNPRARGPA